jgi:uncharacterized membrane protein YqjE
MSEASYGERSRDPGIFSHATAWLATLLAHLRVRLELAGLEGREAAIHGAVLLGLAVGALVLLVFGYFFFCFGLIFLIASAFDDSHAWIWVTFVMALLHFAGAVALALWAKVKLKQPIFPATLDEFRKDHQWLTSNSGKQR